MIFRLPLFLVLIAATTVMATADDLASQVLEEINLARTQPQQYAQIVAGRGEGAREAVEFLQRVRPLPPLAWSAGISQAARAHAVDVGSRGGRGHNGANGDTPWKRMSRFGKWNGFVGENIDYGHADARSIVISLIIDNGVPGRGHRVNLFKRDFKVTGIAVGPHASAGSICVMDFATGFTEAGEQRVAERATVSRSAYSGMSFF